MLLASTQLSASVAKLDSPFKVKELLVWPLVRSLTAISVSLGIHRLARDATRGSDSALMVNHVLLPSALSTTVRHAAASPSALPASPTTPSQPTTRLALLSALLPTVSCARILPAPPVMMVTTLTPQVEPAI